MNVKLPIYWKDPYLDNIETYLLATENNQVILKDDIFYPESGGQESDEGFLLLNNEKIAEITHVKKRDGKSVLEVKWLSKIPPLNTKVQARINIERRRALMRAHTAQHLVSAFLKQKNIDTVHAEIHPDEFIVETNSPLSIEILKHVLSVSNLAILNNLDVVIHYYSPEEISKLDLETRKPLKKAENIVRIVEIKGLDRTFCGGTHVGSLSEIGLLQISSFGKKFIQIVTGKKALHTLEKETSLKISLAKELTTSPEQAFETLFFSYKKLKKELSLKDKTSLELLKFILSRREVFTFKFGGSDVLVLPALPYPKKQLNRIVKLLKENNIQNYIFASMDGFLNIDLSNIKDTKKVEEFYEIILTEFKSKGGGKKGKYTLKLPNDDFDYNHLLKILNDFWQRFS